MNEVIKNMEERRSVRGYKPDMIRKEDLDTIIEAGTYAATGMGMQSPIIVAVTDKATRDQLSAMNAKIMGTDTDPFPNLFIQEKISFLTCFFIVTEYPV